MSQRGPYSTAAAPSIAHSTYLASDEKPAAQKEREQVRPSVLLAGSRPVGASGNAVSSQVLLSALEQLGPVTHLAHRISYVPSYRDRTDSGGRTIEVGVQPLAVHSEALLAGVLHRRRLRKWSCGWAVNSRYAGALLTAGLPFAIWEATLIADELRSTSFAETRANGRGSGVGVLLHSMSLPMGSRLEGLMYRRATVLCAMSRYTLQRIVEQHDIDASRVVLLPHPPSPYYLSALSERKTHPTLHRTAFGSELRLLFVGRLDDPRKGVAELLGAVCQARAQGISAVLTLIGPCSAAWRSRFSSLIQDSRARLLGQVDLNQLAEEYLLHDAFVLPSRQEGFGIVIAEAFHAGLPVISTRCGGPEDVIRESKAGLLVDHNTLAMVDAFKTLAANHDLRRRFATSALDYAERELSFPIFASRVRDLTERLLGHPSVS